MNRQRGHIDVRRDGVSNVRRSGRDLAPPDSITGRSRNHSLDDSHRNTAGVGDYLKKSSFLRLRRDFSSPRIVEKIGVVRETEKSEQRPEREREKKKKESNPLPSGSNVTLATTESSPPIAVQTRVPRSPYNQDRRRITGTEFESYLCAVLQRVKTKGGRKATDRHRGTGPETLPDSRRTLSFVPVLEMKNAVKQTAFGSLAGGVRRFTKMTSFAKEGRSGEG
ncbi:hypothetical protein EVAR_14430_1 [Eumeta japonica]|uniref:Uncharacterized protein n=1 Tax=Eumeta variegata TaxID=151549 RepID=A0A4C1TXD8_EUMVA|nr:hypothetical protein EVAR_14430_1 [Eumeta japonica]